MLLVKFFSVRDTWTSSYATSRKRSCCVRGSTLPELQPLPDVVAVRRLPKLVWLSSFQLPLCLPSSEATRMRSRISDVCNGAFVCWPDDSERFLTATTICEFGLLVSSVTSVQAYSTNETGPHKIERQECESTGILARKELSRRCTGQAVPPATMRMQPNMPGSQGWGKKILMQMTTVIRSRWGQLSLCFCK